MAFERVFLCAIVVIVKGDFYLMKWMNDGDDEVIAVAIVIYYECCAKVGVIAYL